MLGLKSHRRPKQTMIAGDVRRRSIGGQGYGCTHGTIPRRWVVDLGVGEHHAGDSFHSGGRRFGRGWIPPKRAANAKLKRGSGKRVH